MNTPRRTLLITLGMPLALFLVASMANAAITTDEDKRLSSTSQGLLGANDTMPNSGLSIDEYGALVVSGTRNQTAHAVAQQRTSAAFAPAANTDFWIYTAEVDLYADRDRDGFYTSIDLMFDADTYYGVADVYAVLYLSYEYGEWNEYAATETFTIYGASGADEYVVETDLVEGYPTGNYDILIELYDAYDNAFVASFGPEDTSELSILPIEDVARDSQRGTTQIVVNSGGGGSPSWFFLLGLAAFGVLSRKR